MANSVNTSSAIAKKVHLGKFLLLTTRHEKKISELYNRHEQDLTSWTVFTIVLPLITFFFAACINMIYSECLCSDWGKIFNNGSIPIIAFGVISSTIPYLVEKLRFKKKNGVDKDNNDEDDEEIFDLRKRTLAFATVLLFVTAGLFIIQSVSLFKNDDKRNWLLLIVAILTTIFSAKIGRIMFLLQSVYITKEGFGESVEENVEEITASVQDHFSIYNNEE